MKTIPNLNEFETVLLRSIRALIRDWKADGTTSASIDCLMQNVRPPSDTLQGAPRGTNARYFYAQTFRRLATEANDIAAFVRY